MPFEASMNNVVVEHNGGEELAMLYRQGSAQELCVGGRVMNSYGLVA